MPFIHTNKSPKLLFATDSDHDDETGPTNDKTVTDEVELIALCSSVLELLPHIEMSLVKACLKHYNYSTEKVIQVLLEDSLPAELRNLQIASKDGDGGGASSAQYQPSFDDLVPGTQMTTPYKISTNMLYFLSHECKCNELQLIYLKPCKWTLISR